MFLPRWCILCLSRTPASKHVAFHLGLSLNRFKPWAPASQAGVWTVLWCCALGWSGCRRPAGGSSAGSQEMGQEVGKAGPTRSLATRSLVPAQLLLLLSLRSAVKCKIHLRCKAQGGGSQVCPIPGGKSRAGKDVQTCVSWAPVVQSSRPSGGDWMQLALD